MLKKNNYLIESKEFNSYDKEKFSKQIEFNSKRLNNNMAYQDDKRYNDYQGRKWLTVKSRDDYTLISAIIDGLSDVNSVKGEYEYVDINSQDELDLAYYDNLDIIKKILNFLHKYMHGTTTVYRGFNFKEEVYNDLIKQQNIKFKNQLLKYLDNTNKEFNSFSISPMISRDFAKNWLTNSKCYYGVPVMIAAEVEPNDINFAFTAYLMARHGNINEYELNINSLKELKNLRIIQDIDAECKKFAKKTLYDVQKRLNYFKVTGDNSCDPLHTFYDIHEVAGTSADLTICKLPFDTGTVLVRNETEIISQCTYIHLLTRDLFAVYLPTKNGRPGLDVFIYNAKLNIKSEIFKKIVEPAYKSKFKFIIATNYDDTMSLISPKTCKPGVNFNEPVETIMKIPANPYGSNRYNNVWEPLGCFRVYFVNGGATILNKNGKCVFKTKPNKFYTIGDESDTLIFKPTSLDRKTVYTYEMDKNGLVAHRIDT